MLAFMFGYKACVSIFLSRVLADVFRFRMFNGAGREDTWMMLCGYG